MGLSEIVLASLSIFFYSLLAISCYYHGSKYYNFKTNQLIHGRYIEPKFIFFIILFISAILDIPLFIACLAKGGPKSCEWNDSIYILCWLLHLIATCGYTYTIITPAILWSDIIHLKDGRFWNSAYPVDYNKLFFRITYVIFCLNELVTIIGSIIYQKPSNPSEYTSENYIGTTTECITPIILCFITIGCLWSGINLQYYVINVRFGNSTEIKILMHLNFTMLLIVATTTLRALLVLSLYESMPSYYTNAFEVFTSDYTLWMITTRWLPFIFCSFCLVNEMRMKESYNKEIIPIDLRNRNLDICRNKDFVALDSTDDSIDDSSISLLQSNLLSDTNNQQDDDIISSSTYSSSRNSNFSDYSLLLKGQTINKDEYTVTNPEDSMNSVFRCISTNTNYHQDHFLPSSCAYYKTNNNHTTSK